MITVKNLTHFSGGSMSIEEAKAKNESATLEAEAKVKIAS